MDSRMTGFKAPGTSRIGSSNPMRAGTRPTVAQYVTCQKFGLALLVTAALWTVGAATARADGVFPDENLEAAVRVYVFEKKYNDEPITEDDVRELSTIQAKGKKIKDLTGLEKCRSLALLDLEDNEISEVGALEGLERLQSLNLAGNAIRDITPLTGLKSLQYLQLSSNRIDDVKALAKLDRMRSLYLSDNDIRDISPLQGLTKLWSLYLDNNEISDISVLAGLKDLTNLDLKGNEIADLGSLAPLTELKWLFLQKNKITDLKILVEMARKDAKGEKRFSLFWKIYLAGNPLSEAAKTEQVETLRELGARVVLEEPERKS